MERRDFIVKSCSACLGISLIPLMLSGCAGTHYVSGNIESSGQLTVLKDDFKYIRKGQESLRHYIVISNDKLDYPIYLLRASDTIYKAHWMKCSHQGTELQAAGDHLICPAHGSEFNNQGQVTQGPAEDNLRSFNTSIEADKIIIALR